MKSLKTYMIYGGIFVAVLGTLLHFAYDLSNDNFLVGLFTPINESTWEHMKLIFFPMLIFLFYSNKTKSDKYKCISQSLGFSTILGTVLIPILFYTYTGILGFNLAVLDILTFYISVIISFAVAYKGTLSCNFKKYSTLINILIILFFVAFILFTIYPPSIALFVSP